MSNAIERAQCTACGYEFAEASAAFQVPRQPCPQCGATGRKGEVLAAVTVGVSTSAITSVRPGVQDRDWRQRWQQLEQRVRRLVAPQQGERGTAAIYTATQDLFEFLVSAYHLKDALVADQAVARKTVENAINNSSTLALLADLANLEKHRELSRKPRTGEVPIVESFSDYSESDEWRLMVTIRHMGKQVDGVVFASEVMDEWRSHLTAWGLIDGSLRLSGEKTQRRRSRPC